MGRKQSPTVLLSDSKHLQPLSKAEPEVRSPRVRRGGGRDGGASHPCQVFSVLAAVSTLSPEVPGHWRQTASERGRVWGVGVSGGCQGVGEVGDTWEAVEERERAEQRRSTPGGYL